MFRGLLDILYNMAQDPELKEYIALERDSKTMHNLTGAGKVKRAVHGAFTSIANIAEYFGEMELCRTAREMRDENLNKFEEKYPDDEQ